MVELEEAVASQNNWRPQVHEGWLGTATQKVKSGWVLSWLLAWVPVPTQGSVWGGQVWGGGGLRWGRFSSLDGDHWLRKVDLPSTPTSVQHCWGGPTDLWGGLFLWVHYHSIASVGGGSWRPLGSEAVFLSGMPLPGVWRRRPQGGPERVGPCLDPLRP